MREKTRIVKMLLNGAICGATGAVLAVAGYTILHPLTWAVIIAVAIGINLLEWKLGWH